MPTHVIINLAESADAPTGVTSKVKDALETQAKKTERYGFFWCKSRGVNNATIHKYDPVEAFDEGKERYGATIERYIVRGLYPLILADLADAAALA